MGLINRGKPEMVFDWIKAARLIKEKNPQMARAGLKDDWEYTGGIIYYHGNKVVNDDDTMWLASTWATPQLEMDGELHDCYVMEDQTSWDSHTRWPKEAVEILKS